MWILENMITKNICRYSRLFFRILNCFLSDLDKMLQRVLVTMKNLQRSVWKAFCDYNEYEIAGEYEDAGKSGKSIEGRVSFNQIWILLIMKISIISEEKRRKTDSENHLYKTYDKIDEVEELLV